MRQECCKNQTVFKGDHVNIAWIFLHFIIVFFKYTYTKNPVFPLKQVFGLEANFIRLCALSWKGNLCWWCNFSPQQDTSSPLLLGGVSIDSPWVVTVRGTYYYFFKKCSLVILSWSLYNKSRSKAHQWMPHLFECLLHSNPFFKAM